MPVSYCPNCQSHGFQKIAVYDADNILQYKYHECFNCGSRFKIKELEEKSHFKYIDDELLQSTSDGRVRVLSQPELRDQKGED